MLPLTFNLVKIISSLQVLSLSKSPTPELCPSVNKLQVSELFVINFI